MLPHLPEHRVEVARTRGFWEAEGLDVSITYARGGAQAANALTSDSVDWVVTGPPTLQAQIRVTAAKLPVFNSTSAPFEIREPPTLTVTFPNGGDHLVGGAPLNEEFGAAIGADAYCRDAGVAADMARRLIDEKRARVVA